MDSSGLNLLRVQSRTKPSWQVVQTGVLPFWKQEKKKETKEKGADRRAVWRIGAQSEGVEKSLHLNAPLHPNNSSAPGKKNTLCSIFLFFPLLQSIWTAVKGTHLAAIHLAMCVCVCIDVSLFKEVLRWVSGVDCSHCQYCSCGFGCHGNNYARTVQSGQSQYYSTALKLPVERACDRTAVSSYLLNINMCVGKVTGKHSHFLNNCCWGALEQGSYCNSQELEWSSSVA